MQHESAQFLTLNSSGVSFYVFIYTKKLYIDIVFKAIEAKYLIDCL